MKGKKYLSIIVLLVGTLAFQNVSAQILDQITISLKAGKSEDLAKYFNANIELVILKNEDVYSKAQAEQLVKEFFKKHKPTGFELIHKGNKGQSYYMIGKLKTNNGNFRVNMLIKKQNNRSLIYQFGIENQSW